MLKLQYVINGNPIKVQHGGMIHMLPSSKENAFLYKIDLNKNGLIRINGKVKNNFILLLQGRTYQYNSQIDYSDFYKDSNFEIKIENLDEISFNFVSKEYPVSLVLSL